MFLIVTLVIGAIMAVITLTNLIMGVVRGLKRSLGTLAVVVASALVSAVIAVVLCMPSLPVMGALSDAVVGALTALPPEIADILTADVISTTVTYYLGMFAAPFVFMVAYLIISLIASIIMAIFVKKIPILKKLPKVADRLGGLGVGIVCGLLVAVLCVFPVYGVCDMAVQAVDSVSDEAIEAVGLKDTLDSLPVDIREGSSSVKVYEYFGCGLMYDALSSASFEGETVSLRQDVGTVVNIASGVISLANNSEGTDMTETLSGAIADLDRSPLLKNLLAGAFGIIIDNGLIDEFGLDMGELMNPVIDAILEVLATTDKDTVTSDLTTLVNVLGIVIDSGIVEDSDSQAMLKKLGDGLISDMLLEINKNERMYPVSDEITYLSVRALASTLGFPKDADERYDNLMTSIADVLNENAGLGGDEKTEAVVESLGALFEDYGVEIGGMALRHVAEGLISDCDGNATGAAVKEFFLLYHFVADSADEAAQVTDGGFEYLSAGDSKGIEIGSDGKLTVNGVVFEYYNANNYKNSQAYTMGASKTDIGLANTFYSAGTLKSTVLTAEDVLKEMGHYGDCADVEAESRKVGEIFAAMADVVSDKDLENMESAEVFGELGHVFDMMKGSSIFKDDSAKNMLTAILQSDKIMDSIGLSQKDMTDFANKINNYASNRENGYQDATSAISSTLGAINKASDKNATDEEKREATRKMIDDVNNDNAEMISSMVSGDMVGEFGVQVDNSDTVSDSLKNMVYNMAKYKETNPSSEELDSEAEAVTKMLNLAMLGSGDGPMFDKDGEKGSVASDPDSFIAQIVESNVVMNTIDESVEGKEAGSNPYGVTYQTEAEKGSVKNSIENYYVNNGGGEELAGKLNTLAIAMDVDINLQ